MTFRYNPQSIEKQVRKWPVLFSEKELYEDLVLRLNQLSGTKPQGWINPFSVELPFDKESIYEYGNDACRLAVINSNKQADLVSFLEPSFKWIARIHESFYKNKTNDSFNPEPWLEALIQFRDHIIERKSPRLALALVMKAFKESAPNPNLAVRDKKLVYTCLCPFIPVYSTTIIDNSLPQNTINEILESFSEYICVRISLEKGGWHWNVFSRKEFEENPISELSKIKWINKAINGKQTTIKKEYGGIKICFS